MLLIHGRDSMTILKSECCWVRRSMPKHRWGAPIVREDFTDLPTATNECNALLGLRRIALLFLSRGRMYHEDAWTEWFTSVRGLLPKQTLQVSAGHAP